MNKKDRFRKPSNGSAIMRVIAARRNEPLSNVQQMGRLVALRKTLDILSSTGGAKHDWEDLYLTMEVIELVMNDSNTDEAAYKRHDELILSLRSAQATTQSGQPLSEQDVAAVSQVYTLFSELIAVCPSYRLERAEMDALAARKAD